MASKRNITLKDKAVEKVAEYQAKHDQEGSLLRLSLVRTHCMQGRGHSYQFALEQDARDGDMVQNVAGLKVVLAKDQIPKLEGTVVDYQESLEGSGFIITNPNATGKCPCGHHDLFD